MKNFGKEPSGKVDAFKMAEVENNITLHFPEIDFEVRKGYTELPKELFC
jgi:hypothetical protein